MSRWFECSVALVLGLLGLVVYWYINPHETPRFLRSNFFDREIRAPQSPLSNFKPPQF